MSTATRRGSSLSWQDIAAIIVGAIVVAVVLIARVRDRQHHHHRIRFGIFIERNGGDRDEEEKGEGR